MPDRPWKAEERRAAALCGGTRFPANVGGPLDFETERYVGQVKHVQRLSLAGLERLAVEVERLGDTRGKAGVVIVKRRAGCGHATARLVVMTDEGFRRLAPMEPPCVSRSGAVAPYGSSVTNRSTNSSAPLAANALS